MAYYITQSCTACDECLDMCPIHAIHVGDPIYVIDDTCTDFTECLVACEFDAIQPVPDDTAAGVPLSV